MPKPGFKTITVRDNLYDNFQEVYNINRRNLEALGINSLSGFLTYMFTAILTDTEIWNSVIDSMSKSHTVIMESLLVK